MSSKKLKITFAIILTAFALSLAFGLPSASAKSAGELFSLFDFEKPAFFNLQTTDDPLDAPEACAPAPANLVAWYRAENNANDSAGTNSGTLQGATFAAGRVGQTFSFDGADDSVQLPLNQSFQNFTFESWLKPLAAVNDPINQELIVGQASAGGQMIVRPGTNGGMRVVVQYRDTAVSFAQLSSSGDIPLNDWSHLVGTFDGTTLKLYVNGVLDAQTNPANTNVQTCNTPYFIGGFQSVTDCGDFTNQPFQFFNGLIDEASIYNRALSQTEVQLIFNAGSAGKCFPLGCVQSPANQVSWYRGENNALDANGVNNGAFDGTFAAGKVGQAFNFTAANQRLEIPDSDSLHLTTAVTLEAWIAPAQFGETTDGTTIISKGDLSSSGNQSYGLIYDRSGRAYMRVGNGSQIFNDSFTPVLPLNIFSHVVGTFDGATTKIYLDGVLVDSDAVPFGAMTVNDLPLRIGANNLSGYLGKIDEPTVYNRALSASEVQGLFNAGSAGKCGNEICAEPPANQISWYRGENNASDVLNANNGTLQNGATFAAGKVGQGFSFDGANDFVQLPNNVSLNAASRTVEGWIKPEPFANANGGFIYASRDPFFTEGFSVFVGNDGSLLVNVRAANAPPSPPSFSSAVNALQFGQFQHVAVTYNSSSGTLAAYINGVNVPLSGGMALSGAIQPSGNHFIGRRQDALTGEDINGASYFKGSIDELSIYSRALSQTEIQLIFNAGSAGKCLLPAPLGISPTTVNILTGGGQTFTATGGTAPYTFSIFTNNSGGSINAASGVYTAGTNVGTDTVRVTDANNQTANATVSVASAATRLAFTVQPSNAVAGQAISPAIQVAVQDANGNTITNSSAAITLALNNNPNNGGTLSGTLTRNAVNGIAAFNDLSVNRAADGYTLQATANNLTAATSNAFNITPDVAAKLAFVVQPSNTLGGENITPAPQVALQDQFGNTRTDISGFSVTIAIGGNPANGTLSGQTQANFQNGIAAFPLLKINNAGTGYTLVASSAGQPNATSQTFDILSQFVVTNTNNSGAGSLRQAIHNANATAGEQTITFSIPGTAPFKIAPVSFLPLITDAVIIDATTQPGFNGSPVVELSGEARQGGNITGLDVRSGGATIKGLVINRWVYGLRLDGFGNVIQGNYIGTDVAGNVALPNTNIGIYIGSGSFKIGGDTAAERNVISGNSGSGINSNTSDSTINVIQGNYIGTKADGVSALGNGTGIVINGDARSTVIGESGGNGAPNIIAFNGQRGIELNAGSTHIRANSIHSNGGLGIDIRLFGVSANDPLDADEGANGKQNYPVITSVTSANGSTVVRGTLNSTPSANFGVRLYANDICDANGFGEGKTHLGGRGNINTDASGLATFAITLDQPVAVGSFVTATADRFNSPSLTSEFSRCQIVAGTSNSIAGNIRDTNNQPLSGARVVLQGTSISTLTDSNGNYVFSNLPGGFNYTIAPTAPSIAFNPATRVVNNLSANQTNQNFTGTRLSRVSGQITSVINGASFPINGATVTLSGASSATAQTDVNGNYVFNAVPNGSYTATPTKAGFAFLPSSASLNVQGDRTANFSSALTAGLSGRILTSYVSISAFNADGSAEVFPGGGLNGASFGCTGNQCQVSFDAKLSPDGAKIAYLEATRQIFPSTFTGKKMYVVNFDGSNRRLVYNFSPTDTNPIEWLAWSPDGAKIAFTERQNSLKIINADGTNLTTVLPAGSGGVSYLDWSPDGTKILFRSQGISVVNTDGTNRRQLTSGTIDDGAKWSPNGAKIAFIRRPQLNTTGRIFTMNHDGTGQTAITSDSVYGNVLWSPDGAKLAFTKTGVLPTNNFYGVVDPNGANLQIIREIAGGILSWSPIFAPATPAGTNVSTNVGAAAITFNNVAAAGTTTITPIPSYSAGTPPNGYFISGQGYEITTTANYTAPVTVCFTLPIDISESRFNRQSILHRVGGVLIDETTSRDYPTRKICATTNSLSPFAIAEQIDADKPRVSGLIVDVNGKPLSNVTVNLTGAETRSTLTDSNGAFSFVNLTESASYNVQPKQIGCLFSESSQDLVNLTGENAVVFEGATRQFQIGGQITDANGAPLNNVTVNLDGAAQNSVQTDGNGDYVFTNLPADGFYTVTPSNGANIFNPGSATINALTGDAGGVNFTTTLVPTAAMVSVGGRVRESAASGKGVSGARISLTDANGETRTTFTNSFGVYRFADVPAGATYILRVTHRRYAFAGSPRVVFAGEDLTSVDFVASP